MPAGPGAPVASSSETASTSPFGDQAGSPSPPIAIELLDVPSAPAISIVSSPVSDPEAMNRPSGDHVLGAPNRGAAGWMPEPSGCAKYTRSSDTNAIAVPEG